MPSTSCRRCSLVAVSDVVSILRLFCRFLGISTSTADSFAKKYPEVIQAYSAGASQHSPKGDIDPEVLDRIDRGET